MKRRGFYARYVKRGADVVVSGTLLVLISPLFLLIMLLLFVANGANGIFFRQQRPGLRGRIFSIVKFKTMRDTTATDGSLLPDGDRLTTIGRVLRSLSLDELPQLWNVFRGDMSMIGPRPLLVSYLPLYNKVQARRHEVRPGITGWAQVHGRNALEWQRKFQYDVWYVDHLTLKTDLRILWLTFLTVVRRDNISHEGEATMRPFEGNGSTDDD